MDGYWELFWQTGAPVFYLLHRQEKEVASRAKTAWGESRAAAI